MKKITFKKKHLVLFILFIIICIIIGSFLFGLKKASTAPRDLMDFDREGFKEADQLNDTEKLISSNSNFKLYFDETTTHFKLKDLSSGNIWYSNPQEEDDFKNILPETRSLQKSTLQLHYYTKSGTSSINNWDYSISHNDGLKTYEVKYVDDGVQVLYKIGDQSIDKTYFPRKISIKRMEELFLNTDILTDKEKDKLTKYYELNSIDGVYEIKTYDNMTDLVIQRLYEYMYEKCGYTQEEANKDNNENGVNVVLEKPYFEIAIQYKLTEKGVEVTVIDQSIVEKSFAPIVQVDVLQYFGTASTEDEGYILIPDGSGAIMDLNNGKSYQKAYSKRIYGDDLSEMKKVMPEHEERIMFPLYGLIKENLNSGIMTIIEKGASMTSINADVSGRKDSYNKVFPRVHYRENQKFLIASGYESLELDIWTNNREKEDFTISYNVLNNEEANYNGIAKKYREYLEENYDFKKNDNTNRTVLNVNVLGAFDRKKFFLGVPYNSMDSLTTFNETELMLKELKDKGIEDINLIYEGWANNGLSSSLPTNVSIENVLGGKKAFNNLLDYTNENNINFYPSTSLNKTYDYNALFGKSRYTTRTVDGDIMITYPYNLSTKLMDKLQKAQYTVSPDYYQSIINKYLKDYKKLDIDAIGFDQFGSVIASNYQKNDVIYREEAINYQLGVMEELENQGINNVMMNSPLSYMLPHTDLILDAPLEMTMYQIFDYSVPFYQMVLSGYVDYSGISINESSEYGLQWHKLKAIETGGNVNFTFTYEDSSVLLETEYQEYYYTNYRNWLDSAVSIVNELNSIGIHEGNIVEHRILDKGVYYVKYSNDLEILVNYTNLEYDYNGNKVSAFDYQELG